MEELPRQPGARGRADGEQMTTRKAEQLDAVFVQNASAFSAHDDEITLHGVADATIYFANHPQREAGHIPSRRFLELWDGATESFTSAPPAAVISFLADADDAPPDVVVILHDPRFRDNEMTYRVEVRDGNVPPAGGPCSLFIDALRSPLAPASASQRRG
jgi:hypothetical protein